MRYSKFCFDNDFISSIKPKRRYNTLDIYNLSLLAFIKEHARAVHFGATICLFPKNDNSSSSILACIAFRSASFGPKSIVIWEELHKLSLYFILWTVFNSIRDKYIPPEGPHSRHSKVFATLYVRHLESLGLL